MLATGLSFRVSKGRGLLGGSWVVISRVITRSTGLITLIRGHITPLITTPEPPSRGFGFHTGLNLEEAFRWDWWDVGHCSSPRSNDLFWGIGVWGLG